MCQWYQDSDKKATSICKTYSYLSLFSSSSLSRSGRKLVSTSGFLPTNVESNSWNTAPIVHKQLQYM